MNGFTQLLLKAGPTRLFAALGITAVAAAILLTLVLRMGGEEKALLLGPLVVHPAHKGNGFGKKLAEDGLARARAQGFRLVILVGDMPYYGRFGFVPIPLGQITLPGPVDPARLLALELSPGALRDASGLVKAKASRSSA